MIEQNKNPGLIGCDEMEQLATLYACDELDAAERASVEAHAAQCSACAAALARETRLQEAIASVEQPADSLDRSELLLARCRSELAEALDDKQARADRRTGTSVFSFVQWWMAARGAFVAHPVLSMSVLIVVGFLAGVGGQKFQLAPAAAVHPALTVSATPKLTDEQLQSAGSANVAWVTPADSREPTVQVNLMSQMPMSIVGSPADSDVQRALSFVLENNQRFDPDVRLDSLDVLRTHSTSPDVLRAICTAARTDRNPGVRMKALETLQGLGHDAQVQRTVLEALENDDNSGVRVEAINLLVNALRTQNQSGAASADPQVVSVLRDRQQNDPNNYIRLQSAAALRQLGSGELP